MRSGQYNLPNLICNNTMQICFLDSIIIDPCILRWNVTYCCIKESRCLKMDKLQNVDNQLCCAHQHRLYFQIITPTLLCDSLIHRAPKVSDFHIQAGEKSATWAVFLVSLNRQTNSCIIRRRVCSHAFYRNRCYTGEPRVCFFISIKCNNHAITVSVLWT
jgi:hypothetical protein